MSLLQATLDAPSLVFFPPAGTCSLRPSPCLQPAEPAPLLTTAGAGSAKAGGQALGATLRAAIAVQIVCPDNLSLNQTNLPGADLDIRRMPCAPWRAHINYGYAFGPRIKYGAGSGTRWREKSGAIIASPDEKYGLAFP